MALPEHRAYAVLFPYCATGVGISAIFFFLSCERVLRSRRGLAGFCYFMGRISYSLYLFHLLIALWLKDVVGELPMQLQLAIYLGCCAAACSVFFRYFEKPILDMRPHYRTVEKPRSAKRLLPAA